MSDHFQRPRLAFSIRTLFVWTAVFAVLCWAARTGLVFGALMAYAGVIILMMAWYEWSDVAMSICTVLLIVGAIVIAFIGVGQNLL